MHKGKERTRFIRVRFGIVFTVVIAVALNGMAGGRPVSLDWRPGGKQPVDLPANIRVNFTAVSAAAFGNDKLTVYSMPPPVLQ